MTPKSLLRARQARSSIDSLVEGSWHPVLDDPSDISATGVTKVVLCSGKVAYDAIGRRDEVAGQVAVVRVEQLHPWPEDEILAVLGRYPAVKDVVWLQEEPENMGAWTYVHGRLHKLLRDKVAVSHVSRPEAGSPATGSGAVHQLELKDILDRSVGPVGSTA